uniref:Ionotropic receptor 2 n=1 Tax=Cyrtorhinus lividipennis TaxID=1032904 RepID=A0A346TI25_9HEMI|nr:ionotropic receptor 2 [Cyrtorhinus lividipennis]
MLSPALDGVEIRVMDAFCVAANCQLSPVTDDDLWGELYENGTSIGIVGNVLQDNADVGLGAVYLWYYEHIEFVFPYMPSKVTVLLPKPSPLPEWKVPIAPFDWVLWLSLLGSIVLAAIVLFLMNKCLLKYSRSHIPPREFESVSGIILRAVGMAVLQSPENIFTNGSTLRIALTTFQVFFLLYTTIYSSALSSVLTIPRYYPPIDNMRDLYLSGLPWAADHIAWVTTLKEADDPIIKGLLGNFAVFDQETLTVLSKKGGHGFTIELTNGGHVSEAAFLAADMINNLHTMKQPMYHTYSTMIIRKGSPYADELRKIVHRCIDTGLVQMWESMMLTSYGSSSIQTAFQLSKKSRSNEHTGLVKLKLLHTQGAFFILILGTVTGTIIFFMECFFHPRRGGFNGYRQDDVGGLGILVGLGYYA